MHVLDAHPLLTLNIRYWIPNACNMGQHQLLPFNGLEADAVLGTSPLVSTTVCLLSLGNETVHVPEVTNQTQQGVSYICLVSCCKPLLLQDTLHPFCSCAALCRTCWCLCQCIMLWNGASVRSVGWVHWMQHFECAVAGELQDNDWLQGDCPGLAAASPQPTPPG